MYLYTHRYIYVRIDIYVPIINNSVSYRTSCVYVHVRVCRVQRERGKEKEKNLPISERLLVHILKHNV